MIKSITKSKQKVSKKEQIIAYHGYFRPSQIAMKINCSREWVYIIWKRCGLDHRFRIKEL